MLKKSRNKQTLSHPMEPDFTNSFTTPQRRQSTGREGNRSFSSTPSTLIRADSKYPDSGLCDIREYWYCLLNPARVCEGIQVDFCRHSVIPLEVQTSIRRVLVQKTYLELLLIIVIMIITIIILWYIFICRITPVKCHFQPAKKMKAQDTG